MLRKQFWISRVSIFDEFKNQISINHKILYLSIYILTNFGGSFIKKQFKLL